MVNKLVCTILGAVAVTSTAAAVPPMYVPNDSSTKHTWRCLDRRESALEVERKREPKEERAKLTLIEAQINGRSLTDRERLPVQEFLQSLNWVEVITSRCGLNGEEVIIFGYAFETPSVKQRRSFRLKYASS